MKKILTAWLGLLGIHQHLSAEQKQDIAGAAYQATPGAGTAVSFRLAGLPLSDWLVLASIAFVALQAYFLIWKWRRDYLRDQERQRLQQRAREACGKDGAP